MQRREKENKILEKKIDSLIMVVSKLVLILVDEDDDDDEDGPEFITVFTPIESKTLPKLIAQTKFLN